MNSVFITEISLEKGTDVKSMLFYRYQSSKKISFYIDVNGYVVEATVVVIVNTMRALDMFVMIYTVSTHL